MSRREQHSKAETVLASDEGRGLPARTIRVLGSTRASDEKGVLPPSLMEEHGGGVVDRRRQVHRAASDHQQKSTNPPQVLGRHHVPLHFEGASLAMRSIVRGVGDLRPTPVGAGWLNKARG